MVNHMFTYQYASKLAIKSSEFSVAYQTRQNLCRKGKTKFKQNTTFFF